jgi:hypothetical protein
MRASPTPQAPSHREKCSCDLCQDPDPAVDLEAMLPAILKAAEIVTRSRNLRRKAGLEAHLP